MATVGQQLTTPEAGWKRYDDTDSRLIYQGVYNDYGSNYSWNNGTIKQFINADTKLNFKFKGTKLRIIGYHSMAVNSTKVNVIIDGINYPYMERGSRSSSGLVLCLMHEITGLPAEEHTVVIYPEQDMNFSVWYLDAIDIDSDGELLPPEEQALLRVTLNDSSEREYELTATEINGFINWFNKHTSTDDGSFMFNKVVGSQKSKEYLAFNKIISFEVIPVVK